MVRCEELVAWTVIGGNPVRLIKKWVPSDETNG